MIKLCACGCGRVLPNDRFNYLPYHRNKREEPKREIIERDKELERLRTENAELRDTLAKYNYKNGQKHYCSYCGKHHDLKVHLCKHCINKKLSVLEAREKWKGGNDNGHQPEPEETQSQEYAEATDVCVSN